MTETKKILYNIEDIIALGNQLPMIAFKQLKTIVPTLPDDDAAMKCIKNNLESFLNDNEYDFTDNDERAVIRAFQREKKAHPDYLSYYRETERVLKIMGVI
jgi:hypothetical protein